MTDRDVQDEQRLTRIETTLSDMRMRLFGLDGESGLIGSQNAKYEAAMVKISEIQRMVWIALGVWVGWSFLTGSGSASLSAVLKFLAKP